MIQLGATVVGALLGAFIPALLFAYWCGGLATRLAGMENRCNSECERQTREHSRLFQIADEHGKRLGHLEGAVQSLDRRVVIMEGD